LIGILNEENGFHVKCDLRFINHSDEPNAAYYDTLEVCALTDIAPVDSGQFITIEDMSVWLLNRAKG